MNLINQIDGSGIYAQYASSAVNDKNGNDITTTYARKDEIPSTVGLMEESKLEYDGNKISAYNGSAFAGGGGISTVHTAEPILGDGSESNPISANTVDVDYQQITHDDSLVHVSNEAQYALGVNTPVVANEIIKNLGIQSILIGECYLPIEAPTTGFSTSINLKASSFSSTPNFVTGYNIESNNTTTILFDKNFLDNNKSNLKFEVEILGGIGVKAGGGQGNCWCNFQVCATNLRRLNNTFIRNGLNYSNSSNGSINIYYPINGLKNYLVQNDNTTLTGLNMYNTLRISNVYSAGSAWSSNSGDWLNPYFYVKCYKKVGI